MLRARHPSFEQLRAFAVRELAPERRERVADHLGACSICRDEVGLIRQVISVAAETDVALPAGAFDRIRARRAAGERTILPVGDGAATRAPRGTARWRRRSIIVAMLSVGLAGTAAAFATGPVRELLRVWRQQSDRAPSTANAARRPVVPKSVPDSNDAVAPMSGVSLPLTSREIWVAVEHPDPSLRIRFRLTDGLDVEVRAAGSATAAVFRPRENGVGVADAGPGELFIDVPRALHRFVLRVDGIPYIAKTGAELRVLSTTVDTAGSDLILTPSRRRVNSIVTPSHNR